MKVKTIQQHLYWGITRQVGDEYDMEEKDVKVMTAMKHVTEAFSGAILTRELEAEPPKKYRTRDMARDLRAK